MDVNVVVKSQCIKSSNERYFKSQRKNPIASNRSLILPNQLVADQRCTAGSTTPRNSGNGASPTTYTHKAHERTVAEPEAGRRRSRALEASDFKQRARGRRCLASL